MLQLEDEVDHVLAHRGPVQLVQEPTAFEPETEIQCFNKQKVVKKISIDGLSMIVCFFLGRQKLKDMIVNDIVNDIYRYNMYIYNVRLFFSRFKSYKLLGDFII